MKIIKILSSFLLLAYVFYSSGIFTPSGFSQLIEIVFKSNRVFLLLSLFFILVMEVVNAFKWLCLSRSLGMRNSLMQLLKFCFIGRFYNLLLPSNVGGDIIRIRLQGKVSGSYADSAAIVFIERLTGLITLLVLAIFASYFSIDDLETPYIGISIIVTVIGLCCIIYCILDERLINLFIDENNRKPVFITKIANKINKFRSAVLRFRQHPKAIFVSFLNSILFYFFAIINGWIAVKVFDSNVSLLDMMVAIPLIMILMNLPITIGGIGLMEFSNMLVLGLFGISPSVALSVALLLRTKTLISAGMGYVWSAFDISLASPSVVGGENKKNLKIYSHDYE